MRKKVRTPEKPASARDVFVSPVISTGIVGCLLFLCTLWVAWLRDIAGPGHYYTILYLIPVAIASAFLGIEGGVAASIVVLLIVRIVFLNENKHGLALLEFPVLADTLEFATLAAGTLAIAAVTGRLRSTLSLLRQSNARMAEKNAQMLEANAQLERLNQQLVDSELLRQAFNRDVLLAVTAGKLQLVDREHLPPPELSGCSPRVERELVRPYDVSELRHFLIEAANPLQLDAQRLTDLVTAVSEAATNAIKHGGGGRARCWVTNEDVIVLIEDRGSGIAPTDLARATLEKGFSTRISLGMGFHLMLETVDTLLLSTGETGTSILLYVSKRPRMTETEALLARYVAL